MAEYVDRVPIIKEIDETLNVLMRSIDDKDDYEFSSAFAALEAVKVTLMKYPPADVKPVVHGKWVEVDEYHEMDLPNGKSVVVHRTFCKCSNCDNGHSEVYEYPAFCPWCGAEMEDEA